jgi:hypothetical protein
MKQRSTRERRKAMRYVLFILITMSLVLSAVPASSHKRGNVEIGIVSDSGDEFYIIPHRDFRKAKTRVIKKYLEARKGDNYSIVIRNKMPGRVGVVVAVDGRNIISGKKSNLRNNESMYIVDGYGYAKYEGWRTDKNSVHRFYFTDIDDSYSMRTFGDSSAMGVIAVAVFYEKKRPKILYKEKQRESAAGPSSRPVPGKKSPRFESDTAGTGFGDEKYSPVIKVKFKPERVPFQKTLVKYDWHQVLCRKGILKCWPEVGNRLWDESEYAPYPPGYVE